ncbi:MAG: ATP synthase F1 subunit epsilon [Halobacteriovoraceae bacterium]|nr:ATP synthase F1 subunit epsilon [Halobacteriovoraceae bacterium]
MAAFKLDLLTPLGVVIRNLECDDVIIPTDRGEINVLPQHTHVLTRLGTGILTAKGSGETKYYSVTHGICKILGEKISILSMTSETAEDIDVERAKQALKKAEEKLAGAQILSDVDLIKHQRKLERAQMRIRLAYLGEQ